MILVHTTLALLMCVASTSEIKQAVTDLVKCKTVSSQRCMIAASTLSSAGRSAVRPTLRAFPKMKPRAGQILAVGIFSQTKGTLATRSLQQLIRNTKNDQTVRSFAIDSLSRRKGGRVLKTLLRTARDKSALVRAAVIRALGNRSIVRSKSILRTLVRACADTDPAVRIEALTGLALGRLSEAKSLLTHALKDKVLKVRRTASDGLRLVKAKASVGPLIERLQEKDGLLRELAAKALRFQTGEKTFGEDYRLWRIWYESR
jgi:HEAT repeat protein